MNKENLCDGLKSAVFGTFMGFKELNQVHNVVREENIGREQEQEETQENYCVWKNKKNCK